MRVRQVIPDASGAHDPAADEGRRWLAEVYAPADAVSVRLNMITTLTGAAAGTDGTSDSLTSPTDRAILGVIRRHADVVLVGSASVRAEGYLLPRTARLAILTSTGDLAGHRLGETPGTVLLVCPADRADAVRERAALPGAEIVAVATDDGRLDPGRVVAALRERGLTRIVCEGGPSVAAQFSDAGVIDEYCLTVAPSLEPPTRSVLPVGRHVDTTVAGMLVDDAAFSYLRLRPQR